MGSIRGRIALVADVSINAIRFCITNAICWPSRAFIALKITIFYFVIPVDFAFHSFGNGVIRFVFHRAVSTPNRARDDAVGENVWTIGGL